MDDKSLFANFGADYSTHERVTEANFDKEVTPANPSFTVEPKYPGVGVKRPNQGKGTTGGTIKGKYGKKPKKVNRGRSGDAQGNGGGISSGGAGGSLG